LNLACHIWRPRPVEASTQVSFMVNHPLHKCLDKSLES
jgi:hypothetical protein